MGGIGVMAMRRREVNNQDDQITDIILLACRLALSQGDVAC